MLHLEPRHLYRTDQKRPDGLTLVPWADGKQLLWDVTVVDSFADLILRLEPTDVKRFNAFQDRFGSQWLNVIPCKNLRLKLSNQQFRIAIGLRLGSKICERHKCVCGKDVAEDGWHGLSCLKSAGRFSRHSNLNALIKQSLSSTHIPSVFVPFCQMAQRNLPVTRKRTRKGLIKEKVLRRRVGIEKGIFLRNTKNGHFDEKRRKKTEERQILWKTVAQETRNTKLLIVATTHDKTPISGY